jgi:hypothetical protein
MTGRPSCPHCGDVCRECEGTGDCWDCEGDGCPACDHDGTCPCCGGAGTEEANR